MQKRHTIDLYSSQLRHELMKSLELQQDEFGVYMKKQKTTERVQRYKYYCSITHIKRNLKFWKFNIISK